MKSTFLFIAQPLLAAFITHLLIPDAPLWHHPLIFLALLLFVEVTIWRNQPKEASRK